MRPDEDVCPLRKDGPGYVLKIQGDTLQIYSAIEPLRELYDGLCICGNGLHAARFADKNVANLAAQWLNAKGFPATMRWMYSDYELVVDDRGGLAILHEPMGYLAAIWQTLRYGSLSAGALALLFSFASFYHYRDPRRISGTRLFVCLLASITVSSMQIFLIAMCILVSGLLVDHNHIGHHLSFSIMILFV